METGLRVKQVVVCCMLALQLCQDATAQPVLLIVGGSGIGSYRTPSRTKRSFDRLDSSPFDFHATAFHAIAPSIRLSPLPIQYESVDDVSVCKYIHRQWQMEKRITARRRRIWRDLDCSTVLGSSNGTIRRFIKF
ncbi:hypothetical protein AAVH_14803 [Aphelenchoides avenae]|nr:hypothetical protein AAVH_14803 [Aphelenchus avenae]